MPSRDPSVLRAQAEAGSSEAMVALANHLMVGQPGSALREAGAYLNRAAALGNGEASARLAVFSAAGILETADWSRALDHLQRAAEQGWAPAQQELRMLARTGGDSYRDLRSRVDIAAWTRPRPRQSISENPRIRHIPSFFSAEECAWIIDRGRHKLSPALVFADILGARAAMERTNSAAEFTLADADVVLALLHARMAATIGMPSQSLETTQLLHYAPGQQFLPHYDFLDLSKPDVAAHVEQFGQRILTILVYLNDDYEGGETAFPRIDYRFKGRTGDALLFANVDKSDSPDHLTLHAGLPPITGEKWLLSQWVRNRIFVPA